MLWLLCLRSIGMDCVISESCYKETILQRNHWKMTISWLFSNISFIKFHGKKNWEPHHDCVISKSMLEGDLCVIKGLHWYLSEDKDSYR